MKALLIALGLSASAGSTLGAESGLDKWVAAHEPRTEIHHPTNMKDVSMRTSLMKAVIAAPLLCGVTHAAHAQAHATHALRGVLVDQIPQTAPVAAPAPTPPTTTPPSPASARGRIDTAIAAYKESVTEYVSLLDKLAALEATTQKAQIKSKLTGDTVKNSPEVQATYDAKDIAEAKMNAAEAIMDAAIADIGDK